MVASIQFTQRHKTIIWAGLEWYTFAQWNQHFGYIILETTVFQYDAWQKLAASQ